MDNPSWTQTNIETILNFVQTGAIIIMLIITIIQLRSAIQSNRASVSLAITTSHREIWTHLFTNPALERILHTDIDLEKEPPTLMEEFFVVLVTNHMSAVYDAYKQGLHRIYPEDMRAFFNLPIPRKIWERISPYQAKEFVKFINEILATPPEKIS